jgi:hypothetical protein
MDTRFWGPSGWRLLHTITFTYDESDRSRLYYKNFFEALPFVLPCKFCRSSLTEYYRQLPCQDEVLSTKETLTKWMYNIHNLVNYKLRTQGLNPTKDPSFESVKKFYEKWLQTSSYENHIITFWDFLFSIAYNHPKESTPNSKPIPECPKGIRKCNDIHEKNKWNVLGKSHRMYWYKRFWEFLPAVLPSSMRDIWYDVQRRNKPILDCRRSTIAWLWRMRCGMDQSFKDPYTLVCKKIASHASGCSSSLRAKTCRKIRNSSHKTLKIRSKVKVGNRLR